MRPAEKNNKIRLSSFAVSRISTPTGRANSAVGYSSNNKDSSTTLAKPPRTALLARRIPMDMSLPGEESPSRLILLLKWTKWHKVRSIATKGLAAAIVIVITFGALLFSQSYIKMHQVFRGSTVSAEGLRPSVNNELKGQNSGRVNLLILGRDGGNYKNPNLTDTIILASINTVTDKVTLISLPSNLWVNTQGAMYLSSAWLNGSNQYMSTHAVSSSNTNAIFAGFSLVDQSVKQILGLSVDYNIMVNLSAVEQIVNTLGGINVDVPTALNDPTMAWQNGGNPLIAAAGQQTFNGQQALLYVMSKETTSDSASEQRQRDVLESITSKMLSLGTYSDPLKLSSLINTLGNNVVSDLSIKDAGLVYKLLGNVVSVGSLDLVDAPNQLFTDGTLSGQAIVLPSAGLFNYTSIQQLVSVQLPNPYVMKENAKILILNGTDIPGLAANLSTQLKTYGFNVVGVGNTPTNNWNSTVLFNTKGTYQYTQSALEKYLQLNLSNRAALNSINTDGANFVIIIGSNETTSSQNQAD